MAGRRRAIGFAAVCVLAVLAALTWLAVDEPPPRPGPGAAHATYPAQDRATLLAPAVADALLATDAGAVTDLLPELFATTEYPSADAGPGVGVSFSGRVIDTDGAPVPGAVVRHVPTQELATELGIILPSEYVDAPWEPFAAALTGDDGRFTLATREAPPSPARRAGVGPAPAALVVSHGRHAPARQRCPEFPDPHLDVGDIVLGPGASLGGRAVDQHGKPVADAEVRVGRGIAGELGRIHTWAELAGLIATRSDAGGRFRLDGLLPGPIEVELRAPGFALAAARTTLAAGGAEDVGDVTLRRGGRLAGFVVDDHGAPIRGARLKAQPATLLFDYGGPDNALHLVKGHAMTEGGARHGLYTVETSTGLDGHFVFDGLGTDTYVVTASAAGREPVALPPVAVGGPELDVVLSPAATLRVVVVDAVRSEPVNGARVEGRRLASRVPSGRDPRLDVTGPEDRGDLGPGVFEVSPIGFAGTALRVTAPGYRPYEALLVGPTAGLEHRAGMEPGAAVAGRVLDAADAPLVGALVTLAWRQTANQPGERSFYESNQYAETGVDGRFEFTGLASGRWNVSARAPDFAPSQAQSLDVTGQERLDDIVIRLRPGARITGLALDLSGRPKAGARVSCGNTIKGGGGVSVNSLRRGDTDALGRFEFSMLPAGDYTIQCGTGSTRVEVAEGESVDVLLQDRALPQVRGRVWSAGAPARDVRVAVYDPHWVEVSRPESHTRTDAAGNYLLDLAYPGEVVLAADDGGAFTPHEQVALDWGDDRLVDLVFSEGAVDVDARLASPEGAAAAGVELRFQPHVAGPEGEEPSILDRTTNTDELRARRGTTGADGRLAFERVVPGSYRLEADGDLRFTTPPETITVEPGGERHPVRVVLAPGATLEGRVTELGAAPTIPLRLRLDTLGGDAAQRSVNVSPDGTYRITGLDAGSWQVTLQDPRIHFTAPGPLAPQEERQVTLALGQTLHLDLIWNPGD